MKYSSKTRKRIIRRCIIFVLLTVLVFLIDFPIIYMVLNSLKPEAELAKTATFWPKVFTFENYRNVVTDANLLTYVKNSVILTVTSCLIAIFVSACAGYVLSRYHNRATSLYGKLLLALQIFPMILVLIPLFIFFVNLGLLNTRLSLIILYTAICIPYPVWMFKAYFDSIGRELEEAAWIDGCSRPQAFARVVIPLTWPGVIAVAIFSFILCWNEFMMANLFLRKDELKTLPVAIRSFIAAETTNWGQMMAAATIALIPVFILFVFFQRFMIAGYTEGGTKE